MGDAGETRALRLAATATKWLEDVSVDREGHVHPAVATGGQALTALATAGARVSLAEPGRVVCSLRVRAPLTDAEGRWHAGAIAAAADNVCAAAVFTVLGADVVTVQYGLSYFSPAHHDEEVEMDGRVVGRKGKMVAVTVEVRKKESGELVASCRQWMAPIQLTTKSNTSTSSSKL
ncbi:acyl-coenzyme A thioesterase 13 isoform X2 [Sorghum bicolor]|uniref:Thioesterase domain-containing protein n=1 Tax=Sorghum bicolor TaxID=4558 RepID=C5YI37_SORBI|nr:acyl-coenzyme A thioesterase 13 isoform X2 [Sorghum bicolor]EES15320.1 hypothetical protein SORBI_3007G195300 [Sorghum bicolor]|eukprot:XP_002445825.1 acyl-coenzyme A thioesterase 13 isoform X2 [Sorghum bicolor]